MFLNDRDSFSPIISRSLSVLSFLVVFVRFDFEIVISRLWYDSRVLGGADFHDTIRFPFPRVSILEKRAFFL